MNAYAVCETLEDDGDKYFTVVPSSWTFKNSYSRDCPDKVFGLKGNDIMMYSDKKTSSVRMLLNKVKKTPNVFADALLLDKWRCTIVLDHFLDYKSADEAAQAMEMASSESENTPIRGKFSRKVSQTNLFEQILSTKNTENVMNLPAHTRESNRQLLKKAQPEQNEQQNSQQKQHPQPKQHPQQKPHTQQNQQPLPVQQIIKEDSFMVMNDFPLTHTESIYDYSEQKQTEETVDNSVIIVSASDFNSVLSQLQKLQNQNKDLLLNQEKIKTQLNNANENLSRLNAKVDAIAASPSGSATIFSLYDNLLSQPVDNECQFKKLEKDAKNQEFVEAFVKKFGAIFGKCVGGGGTVALQMIYKIFTKDFLIKCSWTGGTRTAGLAKIAFKNYQQVIDLFFKTVQFCDSSYTYLNTVKFLQSRIKNANQIQLTRNIRTSAGRPNRKPKVTASDDKVVDNANGIGIANKDNDNDDTDDNTDKEDWLEDFCAPDDETDKESGEEDSCATILGNN